MDGEWYVTYQEYDESDKAATLQVMAVGKPHRAHFAPSPALTTFGERTKVLQIMNATLQMSQAPRKHKVVLWREQNVVQKYR
jgi:hypothetical protein